MITPESAAAAAVTAGVGAAAVPMMPGAAAAAIPTSLFLWAAAGAFAGLAKSGPDAWSGLQPKWAAGQREPYRTFLSVFALGIAIGINTVLGIALTFLLHRYAFKEVQVADLWPFAVLVSFMTQILTSRVVPPLADALADVVPSWVRVFRKGPPP